MKFFNISNHPSIGWEKEQINAVSQILYLEDGEPEIIDIKFPAVDPTAGEGKIRKLAEEVFGQVCNQIEDSRPDDCAAMVMGEQSLAYHLTRTLESIGIRVYVATTERSVVEQGGVKTSVFKFVKFRRIDSSVPENRELKSKIDDMARQYRKERAFREWKEHAVKLFKDGNGTDKEWTCPFCGRVLTLPNPFSVIYDTAPDVWHTPAFPRKDSRETEIRTFTKSERIKLLTIMAKRHDYNRCGETLRIDDKMDDIELFKQFETFDCRFFDEDEKGAV